MSRSATGFALPEDVAAAQALAEQAACNRCERRPVAGVAVERGGRWVVECLNRRRCDRRVRDQMKGDR